MNIDRRSIMKAYEAIKATASINSKLIAYHRDRGIRIYESFPLISSDPTLIFTNATITPFKHLFTEQGAAHNYGLVQHCLRVGGGAGDPSLARISANYSSLFEMFGSGCFGLSHTEAVAYFIEMLTHVGIPFNELWFTTPVDGPFRSAIIEYGVDQHKVFSLKENGNFWHSWKFGKGGLLGSGITAVHVPSYTTVSTLDDLIVQPEVCIEIGNLIHIFGRDDGEGKVVPIPNQGFEVAMGSARLAIILEQKTLWELPSFCELINATTSALADYIGEAPDQGTARIVTDHLRTISALILNEVLPGTKRESFVLRKMIRAYCEFVWLAAQKISQTSDVVRSFAVTFSPETSSKIVRVICEEERLFCVTLERGARVLRNGTCTDPDELMSTYGVRASLVPFLATIG